MRYRHIPLNPSRRRPTSERAGAVIFWTIGITLTLLLTWVQPLFIFLSIPFLVGFAQARKSRHTDPRHPYDNL